MIATGIKLLFFGSFRDIMGSKEFKIEVKEPIVLNTFLDLIIANQPNFKEILNFITNTDLAQPVIIVLNGTVLKSVTEIIVEPGSELAFLPPIGGG